jgi:hypothetical protein
LILILTGNFPKFAERVPAYYFGKSVIDFLQADHLANLIINHTIPLRVAVSFQLAFGVQEEAEKSILLLYLLVLHTILPYGYSNGPHANLVLDAAKNILEGKDG